MKTCSKCLLPENYPHISYDEAGVCCVCRDYEERFKKIDYAEREKSLSVLFDKYRNKGRRWDCMVPVSGGKDSSYVLYVCKVKYKMRVLAVNFDNGFTSVAAIRNLKSITSELDVDFISYKPNFGILKKLYRTFLLKTGDFCPPCSRGVTTLTYRIARQEKIPLIVLGYNPITDMNPREIESIDQKLLLSVVEGTISRKELEDFVFFQPMRILVKRINLPEYVRWDEKEIVRTLGEVVCSEGGFDGEMHFDCVMSPVADYLRKKKWGFGKKVQKYSALIRDGQMTRDQALEKLKTATDDREPAELEDFMKILDVTSEDIAKVKHLSHLNYKSYNVNFLKLLQKFNIISRDDHF